MVFEESVSVDNVKAQTTAFITFSPFKSRWHRHFTALVLVGANTRTSAARGPEFLHTARFARVSPRQLARAGLAAEKLRDGALLFLSALLLSRVRLQTPRGDRLLAVLVGALGAHGLVVAAQDFWGEQVVKRGWLDWKIPEAIRPSGSWIWLVTLGLAALFAVSLVRARDARPRPG